MVKRFAGIVLLCLAPAMAESAAPRIGGINPPVVQRGVEGTLQVYGKELAPEAELILPFAAECRTSGGGKEAVNVTVKPAATTTPGVYPVRLRTADGISNLRLLVVADVPVVRVQEPNGRYRNGGLDLSVVQAVPIPCIIAGQRLERDIDGFRFAVQFGDRLTFVTETWRVGLTPDPLLRLRNARGKSLVYAHDTPTLQRDERLDFTFAAAGEHYLEMQSTGGGGWNNHYLVQIGAFDYARTVFPLGGRRGEKVAVEVINRDGRSSTIEATVPDDAGSDHWRLPLPDHPGSLPWPLACGDFPEVVEQADHDEPQRIDWPCTVNGRIGAPGEQDLYRIAVQPGQTVRVSAEAYHLGSALDGYLMVYDPAEKKLLAKNDDTVGRGNPDPGVDFEVPEGVHEVVIALRDTLSHGGVEYPYRLTVEPGGPDFLLWLGGKQNPTNEEDVGWHRMDTSDTLNLTPGKEAKLRLSVRRAAKTDDQHYSGPVQGYTGPIIVRALNLPAGVSAAPLVIPAGETTAELIVSADATAPQSPFEILVSGEGVRPDGTVIRHLAERRLYLSDPALPNLPWNWRVQKVTCAVTRQAASVTTRP